MLGLRLPNTAATARRAACGHRRAMGDATVGPSAGRRAAAGGPRTTLTFVREDDDCRVYYGKIKTHTDTPFTTSAPSVGFIND